jgi:hypothetical protein
MQDLAISMDICDFETFGNVGRRCHNEILGHFIIHFYRSQMSLHLNVPHVVLHDPFFLMLLKILLSEFTSPFHFKSQSCVLWVSLWL